MGDGGVLWMLPLSGAQNWSLLPLHGRAEMRMQKR